MEEGGAGRGELDLKLLLNEGIVGIFGLKISSMFCILVHITLMHIFTSTFHV